MKRKNFTVYYIVAIAVVFALIVAAYSVYYKGLVENFSGTGSSIQSDVDSRISTSTCFIEMMTDYGDSFFKNGGTSKDSDYFRYIGFDAAAGGYSMDVIEGTELTKKVGNLTGLGEIPQSGIGREEINFALNLDTYFAHFFVRLPELAWIYYTSENGFVNIYPFVASKDFKYSEELKGVQFYSMATPENDPSREAVWTPVYVDAAGKGLMITLSAPIYYGSDFMGVISLDFTTDVLGGFMKSDYETYLVDDGYNIIAASPVNIANDELVGLQESLGVSDAELQVIKNAQPNQIRQVGSRYFYKAAVNNSAWLC